MKILILLFLTGCGLGPSKTVDQTPAPAPYPGEGGNGGNDVDFNSTVKPVLDQHCALSGCHAGAGFVKSESGFKNSNGPKRVINGSMPPSYSPTYGAFGREEKQAILTWYDSNM